MSNEDPAILLATKKMFQHKGPFTEEEISIAVITEIFDCLADAGLLEKTIESDGPRYRKIGTWTLEEAEAIVESYMKQEAKKLGVKL